MYQDSSLNGLLLYRMDGLSCQTIGTYPALKLNDVRGAWCMPQRLYHKHVPLTCCSVHSFSINVEAQFTNHIPILCCPTRFRGQFVCWTLEKSTLPRAVMIPYNQINPSLPPKQNARPVLQKGIENTSQADLSQLGQVQPRPCGSMSF